MYICVYVYIYTYIHIGLNLKLENFKLRDKTNIIGRNKLISSQTDVGMTLFQRVTVSTELKMDFL